MTLGELRTELLARGFDYLSTTRANAFLNQAISELAGMADWSFLYADASGAPPLTIADIGRVLSVTDSTNDQALVSADRRMLSDAYPDLPDTGTPTYYYLDAETSLAVYPANTGITISVRYIKVPAVLDSDDESPVIPSRYADVILDLAVIRAYKDRDNFDAVLALRPEVDRGLSRMYRELLDREGGPTFIELTGASTDW